MRALTLTQPWAGLIASGIKLVENRPRRMIKREDFGKRFAIHASREIDESVYARIHEIAPELPGRTPGEWGCRWFQLSRITSAVIAVAAVVRDVTDEEVETGAIVDPAQRRWFFGQVGYVLEDVVALPTPVPCKGMLGFWPLPADIERAVVEQLGERAA